MDFLGKHIGNTSLSHQGPLSHGVARRRRNVVVNGFDLGEALMEDEKLPETGRVDDEFWEIMSIAGVGIDVPTIGDWFHVTKAAISVGDEISPFYLFSWVM